MNQLSDKKRNIISWIGVVISYLLIYLQYRVMDSTGGKSTYTVSAIGLVIGIINIALLIFENIIYSKDKSSTIKKVLRIIGVIIRIIAIIIAGFLATVCIVFLLTGGV